MSDAAASCIAVFTIFGFGLLVVACLFDLGWRLVPNSIPLAVALSGLGARIVAGDAAYGALAASCVFVAAAFCWRRCWLGGADVKLLGAGALLVPPGLVPGFVLATCLAGGAVAVLYLAAGLAVAPPGPICPASRLARLARIERRRLRRHGPLPYATAIAAGAGIVLAGA